MVALRRGGEVGGDGGGGEMLRLTVQCRALVVTLVIIAVMGVLI